MSRRSHFDVADVRRYRDALTTGKPPVQQTMQAPVRPPGFVSDYLVPVLHAITWGALLASLATILYNHWGDPQSSLVKIWSEYFLIATVLAYLVTSAAIWNLLWVALERGLERDLDGSGEIGDRPIIRGRPSNGRTSHGISGRIATTIIDDMPDDEEEEIPTSSEAGRVAVDYPFRDSENTMQWFVRVAGHDDVGTGSRIWEPILGRKRYQQYRDALIDSGWARWNAYDDDDNPLVTTGWSFEESPEEIYKQIS